MTSCGGSWATSPCPARPAAPSEGSEARVRGRRPYLHVSRRAPVTCCSWRAYRPLGVLRLGGPRCWCWPCWWRPSRTGAWRGRGPGWGPAGGGGQALPGAWNRCACPAQRHGGGPCSWTCGTCYPPHLTVRLEGRRLPCSAPPGPEACALTGAAVAVPARRRSPIRRGPGSPPGGAPKARPGTSGGAPWGGRAVPVSPPPLRRARETVSPPSAPREGALPFGGLPAGRRWGSCAGRTPCPVRAPGCASTPICPGARFELLAGGGWSWRRGSGRAGCQAPARSSSASRRYGLDDEYRLDQLEGVHPAGQADRQPVRDGAQPVPGADDHAGRLMDARVDESRGGRRRGQDRGRDPSRADQAGIRAERRLACWPTSGPCGGTGVALLAYTDEVPPSILRAGAAHLPGDDARRCVTCAPSRSSRTTAWPSATSRQRNLQGLPMVLFTDLDDREAARGSQWPPAARLAPPPERLRHPERPSVRAHPPGGSRQRARRVVREDGRPAPAGRLRQRARRPCASRGAVSTPGPTPQPDAGSRRSEPKQWGGWRPSRVRARGAEPQATGRVAPSRRARAGGPGPP